MTSQKHMTNELAFRIGKTLETVLVQDGPFWIYADGQSDKIVALQYSVTDDQISRLRVKLFGKLKPGGDGSSMITNQQLKIMFHDLEARISMLEERIAIRSNGAKPQLFEYAKPTGSTI